MVERPARAWSGLLGVVVLVASVLLAIGLAFTPVPVLTVVPITVFIVVLCSLVIVHRDRPGSSSSSAAMSARSGGPG